MLKKIYSFLLALLLAFSLTGCSEEVTTAIADEVANAVVQEITDALQEDLSESETEEDSAPAEEIPQESEQEDASQESDTAVSLLPEDGAYTTAEDVALYLVQYGHLPDNFITKKEARALGWEGGGLEQYAPGMCIGGDKFGNYEGYLPEADGRVYTECDIDTLGASSRGAKRIVFSNDGLIYYTPDHYETFTLLYGEE